MKNIIFDCDPGIDDALALLMAFADKDINVKAITVVGGNQNIDETLKNTLELLSFVNLKCEVAKGAAGPIMRKLVTAPEVHGETGLGGQTLPKADFNASELTANELIHKTLSESEEKMIIVATAPLTNIAQLFLTYPEDREKIEYISVMGGACFGGNQSPCAEFNIQVDPESAKIVFDSGVPIYMHGLDVTTKAYCTQEDVERIRAIGSKVSDFTAKILDFYMEFHKTVGYDVLNMHDLCAAAFVTHPELFTGKECNVEIETKGEITYGETVVDYEGITGKPNNATVMFDIDREAFVEMFIESIKSYGEVK